MKVRAFALGSSVMYALIIAGLGRLTVLGDVKSCLKLLCGTFYNLFNE